MDALAIIDAILNVLLVVAGMAFIYYFCANVYLSVQILMMEQEKGMQSVRRADEMEKEFGQKEMEADIEQHFYYKLQIV